MKQFISKYGGVIFGSLYGLTIRIIFGSDFGSDWRDNFSDLFSVTFIMIVPIIIGITPLLFATKEQLESNFFRISRPILTVLLFFIFCFWTGSEDIICIIIISIPFLLGALLGGTILAATIINYRKRKGIMYSIFLIPMLTGLFEEQFPTPSNKFEIKTSVIINSKPQNIWENVIRVKQIDESEYRKGFFNYAGIPRPLYAELSKDTIGATRIGHFEGGLTFNETVINWNRNKEVSFDIKVIPSSMRNTIFEQHIIKGNHFKFLNASYKLNPINDKQTELTLTSSYQLNTKINFYGSYWGNKLLTDFQERLLEVIKNRCDK